MANSHLNFICIGAPRSGTTWLTMALRRHPQVFIPPVKELRHFLQPRPPEERKKRAEALLLTAKNPLSRRFLEKWRDYDGEDDAQYIDLFNLPGLAESGRVVGELSPIYCIANPKQVRRIRKTVGRDGKYIFLMRNPIDRDLSHLGLLAKNRAIPDLETARKLISQRNFRLRSDYVRTVQTWRDIAGTENLLTLFYDHVVQSPRKVLQDVCRFLDVQYNEEIFSDEVIAREVNSARGNVEKFDFAPVLRKELAAYHLDGIKALCELFPDSPAEQWRSNAESLAEAAA